MSIQFERESLYEEVWSTPLTKLGKKYGLSDNGVRKVCIAMNIPLPKAGHWAKIAAGYQIPKTPLPESSKVTTYVSNPIPAEPASPERTEDEIWLDQHELFESDPINHIVVDLQPKNFHPLLLEARSELIKKAKESEKLIAESQKEANRAKGNSRTSNTYSTMLSYFERNGKLLELHRWGMPLRLSLKTWERGLDIMNALFIAAEKRGFEIVKDQKSTELCFKADGGEVYIRMSEKFKQEVGELINPTKLELFFGPPKIKIPLGILRFHLRATGSSSEIEISEKPDKPLQNNLNQVFCRIYKQIVKSRAKKREWAEWERKQEEENKRREEREKIRQENLRIQAIETQKRNALLKDAIDWQNSELIYKYVNHLDAIEDINTNEKFLEWKKWAISVASELDPTSNQLKQII